MFERLKVPAQSELYHWADYIELMCLVDPDNEYSAERLAQQASFADDLMETSPDAQDVLLSDVMDLLDGTTAEMGSGQDSNDENSAIEDDDSIGGDSGWMDFGRDAEIADDRSLWCRRIFQLLWERGESIGEIYPFNVDVQFLTISRRERSDERLLYVFYLACSSLSFVSKMTLQSLTSHFEKISAQILRSMLPSPFEIDMYGTARGETPSRFTGVPYERIKQLNLELRGSMTCQSSDFHPKDRADNGLDLVAWLPMGDSGKGVPSYFCQCACGEKWEGKQYEASYDRWSSFFYLASAPAKITFIPYYFRRSGEEWYAPADVSGLLIDRLRAIRFISQPVLSVLPRSLACLAWDYKVDTT